MQRVQVGRILKPRGLKGEVKCQVSHTSAPASGRVPPLFARGEFVRITDCDYKILNVSEHGGFVYLYLDGITTIEQAESLRNKFIEIDRENLELAADEIFTSELIDFEVIDTNGKKIGTVKSIENYGASDIVDCGDIMFPYEDAFVIETNMTKKQIVIRGEML